MTMVKEQFEVVTMIEITYDSTKKGARKHLMERVPDELRMSLSGCSLEFGTYNMEVYRP